MRKLRKIFWYMFYTFGGYLTTLNILGNYLKYAKFQSTITERHEKQLTKFFPKIILCPNSMHSKWKGIQ